MGKIKQGILGGFNGTTGSVVGASWKGIAYMRGKAQSISNPRTEAQQNNRTKFGEISDVCSKLRAVINEGFRYKAVKQSAFNAAVKSNMDVQGDFSMSTLKLSEGGVVPFVSGSLSVSGTSATLTANLSFPAPKATEARFVLVAKDRDTNALLSITDDIVVAATSSSATTTIQMSASVANMELYAYAYMKDEGVSDVSNSLFLGSEIPD